jgi:hypothetical protein
METMATPPGPAKDFERKLTHDLQRLIGGHLEIWIPHVTREHAINITLTALAFCGVTVANGVNAPKGTFAGYAKKADEILRKTL